MVLSGVTVDIGCFCAGSEGFADRFAFFPGLAKLSLTPWSFSAEIGLREAFGAPSALPQAVASFREMHLIPRLFTTGSSFENAQSAISSLEELSDAGVQQILLRLNDHEASTLPSQHVRNLVDGCQAGGIDLRIRFEMEDTFAEDYCRIARTVEDRQFTVTVLPTRIRPVRTFFLSEAPRFEKKDFFHLEVNSSGEVVLQKQKSDETLRVHIGNLQTMPLHTLVREASARL